jgi:Uma2 family endonuclease
MSSAEVKYMTAEEFAEMPDDDRPRELVRGEVVYMNVPFPRHGEICANIVTILKTYLQGRQIGRVVSNDSGVVTERGPDTVRGADVAYYSYARVPKGPLPLRKYVKAAPEIVFEVWSPFDRWPKVYRKVSEYQEAGVIWVCVVIDPAQQVRVFHAEEGEHLLEGDDEVTFPELLPDFRVPVLSLFE